MKSISLVLGSGGARGLAHIGVITWLEEHGYDIQHIAGSSIGAVIGGIHATGKLSEFEQWVRAITRMDIVTYLDIAWGKGGFVKGDRIINALVELVGNQLIEDLPMRFTAVATDLEQQKEVHFSRGRLFDALRASMSVPLIFTPFDHQGIVYVDGGVLNPVPVTATLDDDTDLTVAVHFSGVSPPPGKEQPTLPSASLIPPGFQDKVRAFMQKLQTSEADGEKHEWGTYEVAIQSFEAMQGAIAQQKLAAYPPDVIIDLPRNACRTLDYDRAGELIAMGYERANTVFGQRSG